MKRTPLKRKTRLARGRRLKTKAELRRGCSLPMVNSPRRERRRLECHGTRERSRWIYTLPCLCGGQHPACSGDSVPAHVKSVGAGGKAGDIVAMSWGCHGEQHQHGWGRWCELAGITMEQVRAAADALALEGPDAPGVG